MSSAISAPPGASCPPRFGQRLPRVGKVRQEEPGVDDVEPVAIQGRFGHVADAERDIVYTRGIGLLPGHPELRLVQVDADHGTFAGQARERERDVTAATADVEAPGRRLDTDACEQRARRGRHDPGENPQALSPSMPPRMT
jgi:hypothetical protein